MHCALDRHLFCFLKPKFTSPIQHVDRPLSNSRSSTPAFRNEELLPFAYWWNSHYACVGKFMRIWISCLDKAGHPTRVCVVSQAIGSLNCANGVPLYAVAQISICLLRSKDHDRLARYEGKITHIYSIGSVFCWIDCIFY